MNSVNLFELNRNLRCFPVVNNISRRENSIIIKEIPIINQEPKEKKSLCENLNELIEKNAKLNTPNSNDNNPQVYYRNINNNYNNNYSKLIQDQSPEKITNKSNSINKQNIYNHNDLNNNKNQDSSIKRGISPKSENFIINSISPNIDNNKSFMKSVNNVINQAQGSELNNKNLNSVSLSIEKNIPLSLIEFGKFLIKYIEKEENYRLLFEKEIKKIKDKIKKIFDKNNQSDHCLLDYILELWDKLEVSYSVRYKILMDFCKK